MIVGLIVGIIIGFVLGFCCGTTLEQKLWLDAICGREKIVNAVHKEEI
jgi:hypothetical protein